MKGKSARYVAILAVLLVTAGFSALPAGATGPAFGSIITSVNPAIAGQDVGIALVVRGSTPFVPPVGVVQLFDGLLPLGPPLLLKPSLFTDHSEADLTHSFSQGLHLLTLDYSGDPFLGDLPFFNQDPVTLVVTAPQSTTTVSSSANPSVYGQAVTWTAAATNSGAPAVGSIQFNVDGAAVDAAQPVNGSGNASVGVSTLSVGNHSVSADFTSASPDVLDSSGVLSGGQVVTAADTATTVSSSANPSEYGAPTTFTANVSVNAPGAGTATGTVQFQSDGTDLGVAQSLDAGQASVATSALSVGSHTISAVFTSDTANYNGSSGIVGQTVDRARTTLHYDGAVAADFDDATILSAGLTRTATASPVAGETVMLAMGAESCSAVTDGSGEAACTVTPSEAAGARTVTATFAGDGNYQPSSDSAVFTVTREETTTVYTGPTVIAQGNPVVLSGRLLEDGVSPLSGRTLTLTVGSGSGSQKCVTGSTDGSGNAQCTIPSLAVTQGPQPVNAAFSGDGYYLPSADASASVLVFAFPSRGIFTLGSLPAAGRTVTFWGAQWSTQNLVAGLAFAAFKGFGMPSSQPPACGGTWTSSPGNSSAPVDAVPAYMGTVVSTSMTKNGSTFGGRIAQIVVVATDRGYAPNPGHPGTGTIVATYC